MRNTQYSVATNNCQHYVAIFVFMLYIKALKSIIRTFNKGENLNRTLSVLERGWQPLEKERKF